MKKGRKEGKLYAKEESKYDIKTGMEDCNTEEKINKWKYNVESYGRKTEGKNENNYIYMKKNINTIQIYEMEDCMRKEKMRK